MHLCRRHDSLSVVKGFTLFEEKELSPEELETAKLLRHGKKWAWNCSSYISHGPAANFMSIN